ncbi:MAG: RagB/SusD family nutrient uptake outer membrane protein [Bacteroidia bacterium]|nr:RagB/SusD family nutrient uptake outer membrane protein [Bacteroidia bacterium]
MKQIKSNLIIIILLAGLTLFSVSCVKDLLDQEPTTQLGKDAFWKTNDDALFALTGVYTDIRTIFEYDYYFDGAGEFQFSGNVDGPGAYSPGKGMGSGFDFMWNSCYAAVNHANYTIENLERMIAGTESAIDKSNLGIILAETRFLRGLAYFRLIQMWGDVPYLDKIYSDIEAITLSRTPINEIHDKIYEDFTSAVDKLPATNTPGRATKAAAYGYRGKLQLFWASWNKFGWPELTTFTPDAEEAVSAYNEAASDFAHVIDDFGLTLFRNGAPGLSNDPNYFYLFQPDNENDREIIFAVCHVGPELSQGEIMMREFGTRNNFGGQGRVSPTNLLADRYQLTKTGDFATFKLVLKQGATIVNGACNSKSYEGRDYRMRATMIWDSQKLIFVDNSGEIVGDSIPLLFGKNDGVNYINAQGNKTGYIYRKWIRYQAGLGGRTDGPQDFYLMRLADVYLMYAEASNFANGPTPKAIDLVNKVRYRGGLPVLLSKYTGGVDSFFEAIEQERIVELATEGHRFFDIRRWHTAKEIWSVTGSAGITLYSSWGIRVVDNFMAASDRDFEQYYINRIPLSERERNPNLTQNTCWY